MRTTRVQATPSSIFRNSKQYLHSNELIFRVVEEGDGQRKQRNPQQHHNRKSAQQKNVKSTKVLKKVENKLIIRGLQFDADNAATVRNALLKHSVNIKRVRDSYSRLSTYRTSI